MTKEKKEIKEKKIITTSVRIPLSVKMILEAIAEYENRSLSNLIQLFLFQSAQDYLDKHDNKKFAEFFCERVPVDFLDKLRVYGIDIKMTVTEDN